METKPVPEPRTFTTATDGADRTWPPVNCLSSGLRRQEQLVDVRNGKEAVDAPFLEGSLTTISDNGRTQVVQRLELKLALVAALVPSQGQELSREGENVAWAQPHTWRPSKSMCRP